MNKQRNIRQPVTDIQGAADYMMVPVETIQALIEQGELRHTRIGSFIRCRYLDLDHYLRRNTAGNRELFSRQQSVEIQSFINGWKRVFGSKTVSPTDLNSLCKNEDLLMDKRGNNGDRSQAIRLGILLASILENDFDGLCVMRKLGRNGMVYYLKSVDDNANIASAIPSQPELHRGNFKPIDTTHEEA